MKKKSSYALCKLQTGTESAQLQGRREMSDQLHYENEGFAETEDDVSAGSTGGQVDASDPIPVPGLTSQTSMSLLFSLSDTRTMEEGKVHYDNDSYVEIEGETAVPPSDEPKEAGDRRQVPGDWVRHESVPLLFAAIHAGNIEEVERILDENGDSISLSSYGGLTPLHAACHMQHLDVLRLLMARGAKVHTHDSLGNFALHVAVREKWYDGVRELLQHGASPDKLNQPPSGVTGVVKENSLHVAVRMGDKVSTNLMLKHQPDLIVRDGNNQTVFHLAASRRDLSVLRELLADSNLPKYMKYLEKFDGQGIYHAVFAGDNGLHNESAILRVIQCIYTFHENVNQTDGSGETPLITACRSGLSHVVKFLLDNGADPAKVTHAGESALHAVCKTGCSTTLRHLFNTGRVGHLISSTDNIGCHPFYYAVETPSVDCCKVLLEHGERLTNVDRNDISNMTLVIDKLPNAMQLLRDLFDAGIKLSKKPQHDPAFSITFDYSVLMSLEKEKIQCSIVSDLSGTAVEPLIKHPLIESFLYIKWCRIRRVFYTNVIQYFLYLLLHTSFVMMSFGPKPRDWTESPSTFLFFQISHLILLLIIAGPGIVVTLANYKKYLTQWETYTRLTALVSSAIVVCVVRTKNQDDVTNPPVTGNAELSFERLVASMSVVLGWVELMMLLGRFPTLGAYILMFTKVGKSVCKFLLAFLSLLLGFSLGFHILFQRLPIFADYNRSFVKTLMMMTGEIAYSEFIDKEGTPFNAYSLLFLSIFLFMTTIIMSNLLIGLAVNDIPDLKRQGKIKRLVKQASYLMAFEKLLSFTYRIKFFPRKLQSLLASRLSIKPALIVLPNKEFKKNKYMRTIPDENIREAITLGSCESPEDFPTDADEDIGDRLKFFQIRYSSDRRTQKVNFKDISETCNEIKKQLEQVERKTNNHLTQLAIQLQQQVQQNQNLYNYLTQKGFK
ncbi:transient receptor potential channel pyrexia-like isoform X2 [Macrobrachium nipponense]|uniref:transient receptor potential channel pyrexia-like isoform X2 n=1 Tax=Macrobrachium nipponense TaxID=159736 RepID=UPI0030C7FA26